MNGCISLTIINTFVSIKQYKLCKIKKVGTHQKGVPFVVTHDGRTIRYPDPLVKVNDTVQVDIESGKIKDYIKFDSGEYSLKKNS